MTEKRRIVVNTLANGTAQFAQLISALVLMPFLVRGFGATNYGTYLLASSISGYAGLLDLGVGTSVVKLTAESSAKADREGLGRVVSSALAFYVLIGLVAALVFMGLALNTGSLFKLSTDGARLLRNLFLVAAVWQLWMWPSNTSNAVLMGHQRYTQTSMLALLTMSLNVTVTIAVLVTGQGPLLLMAGSVAASLIVTVLQAVLAHRALGDVPISRRLVDRSGFRSIFGFAWAIFIFQVCTVIVYQQTDRIVLGVFLGATAVALYEAAGKFQGLVSQLTTFTVSAVLPMASQLDAQGRHDAVRTLFLRGTKYSTALLNPIVLVLLVVARPLLQSWLGSAFAAYAVSAQILISHQLLTSSTGVGDAMIAGLGQLKRRIPYVIAVAALNLAISLALVQRYGILGVVLGTAIPYFIDFPFHMRIVLRAVDVPVKRWLKETVLPTYPLLLIPLIFSWTLTATSISGSLLGVAAIGLMSVGAYWIAVYALGFTRSERAEVRGAVATLRARART